MAPPIDLCFTDDFLSLFTFRQGSHSTTNGRIATRIATLEHRR